MDPQACFERWLNAWRDGDTEELEAATDDYNDWIYRGGFSATLPDERPVNALTVYGEISCGPRYRGTTAEKVLRDRGKW